MSEFEYSKYPRAWACHHSASGTWVYVGRESDANDYAKRGYRVEPLYSREAVKPAPKEGAEPHS